MSSEGHPISSEWEMGIIHEIRGLRDEVKGMREDFRLVSVDQGKLTERVAYLAEQCQSLPNFEKRITNLETRLEEATRITQIAWQRIAILVTVVMGLMAAILPHMQWR